MNDGSDRQYFILRTEEDFQKAALEIISERAADGSFYPTREELQADREEAFARLVEIYGTVTPKETKAMDSKENIKALSDYFNRKTIATELEKAYKEDLQFIDDLAAILSYSDDEIDQDPRVKDYVYSMASFLLFKRREYPGEQFDFEELDFKHSTGGNPDFF